MKKRIRDIIKKGPIVNTELFRLSYKNSRNYKIGFIASSKIGKSVKRNYVKRIIRECWKRKFEKGNFIFILKSPIINLNKKAILDRLEQITKKVK